VSSGGPNCGSVFTERLPAVAASGSAVPLSDQPRMDAVKRRVLIVEDNRDAREMFRMMLELDGHDVLEAEDGCAGLEMLKSEMPDIAFIDVGLPGLDGYEIARRFRCESDIATSDEPVAPDHACKRVLLVALTGYGTPDALERSRRAGFDHHLIKPVNPETLYKLLNAEVDARASETAPLKVAAPAGRLYNERLTWCGVEQSGSSSGS